MAFLQPKGSTIGIIKTGATVQEKFDSLDQSLQNLTNIVNQIGAGGGGENVGTAWQYTAVGNDASFVVGFTGQIVSIPYIFVNGVRQEAVTNFTYDANTKTITLVGATLTAGDLVTVVILDGTSPTLTKLADPTGATKIGWKRTKITDAVTFINTTLNALDSTYVSIWEFADKVISKPTANDPQTWDWSPAFDAAILYSNNYVSQTAVNAAMWGTIPIYVPPGVYKISKQLDFIKQENSTGTLASIHTIVGAGMTSSVIQPTTASSNAFVATNCKVNIRDIGFRAGANYCIGGVFGSKTAWTPAFHCNLTRVGFSGFARGVVFNLVFDSTFEDVFVQNIADMQDTTQASYGITFETYTGPANGGTTGNDDSNQVTFIRPTIETANANNTIMFNISGLNRSYPHHAINVFGGHIETHNLQAKCYNLKNAFNVNFYGTVFSQNGNAVTGMYRLGWIESCYNIVFSNCRQVTTNRLAAYDPADVVLVKVTGTTHNVTFERNHFISPYNDMSVNTYKYGLIYVVDYNDADIKDRSCYFEDCTMGVYTNKSATSGITINSVSNLSTSYNLYVNDASNGSLSLGFSTSLSESVAPTVLLDFTKGGGVMTTADLHLGAKSTAASSRSLNFYGSGDGTTITSAITGDNAGRLYLKAMNAATQIVITTNAMNPTVDNTISLGSNTAQYANGWFGTNLFVNKNPVGVKVPVPGSSTATGSVGQWAADASAFYVCVAANTWVKTALATW